MTCSRSMTKWTEEDAAAMIMKARAHWFEEEEQQA